MSARDDYPLYKGWGVEPATYNNMADEIDRLRTKAKADQMVWDAINSLVRELTVHADAMRDLLKTHYLIAMELDRLMEDDAQRIAAVVDAYDNFIREA